MSKKILGAFNLMSYTNAEGKDYESVSERISVTVAGMSLCCTVLYNVSVWVSEI